ncbi:hypothetical protein WJ84_31425 [Burkholderia ubonensis]|nr:hypothetical protein WJ84_31425 [Burkholderia ubonensis]
MELENLRVIVAGLKTLSKVEKAHPVLGAKLLGFATEVGDCCNMAYTRLEEAFSEVVRLSSKDCPRRVDAVYDRLTNVGDAKWFKEVTRICARLEAVSNSFALDYVQIVDYMTHVSENSLSDNRWYIDQFYWLLQGHERNLKHDVRSAVAEMQARLASAKESGDFSEVRRYANEVRKGIEKSIDSINNVVAEIKLSSKGGVNRTLSVDKAAEAALRRPERVLILNMFFVLLVLALGATIFQWLAVYQFVLLAGFATTIVVVLNAMYLKSIGALSDLSFLKLMQLALLKFFAPITKAPPDVEGGTNKPDAFM